MNFFKWLFCLYPLEKSREQPIGAYTQLLNSMRMTAKCRFNASVRLSYLNRFSLFTATYLSLGLILIPLIQNADIPLHFHNKVMNLMQVFLAVAVLVYSTINATARYDARSIALDDCGNRIKHLTRKLRATSKEDQVEATITVQKKYDDAVKDSENHIRLDYLKCMLEAKDEFKIVGLKWVWYNLKVLLLSLFPFVIPMLMLLMESIFILDMLGVTSFLPIYFGGDPTLL